MRISRQSTFKTILALFLVGCGVLIAGLGVEIFERSKFQTSLGGAAVPGAPGASGGGPGEGIWEVKGKSYRKNSHLEAGDIRIRINSRGFRAPEYEVPRPEGVLRVICIGGSTTFEGAANEWTYPALVQRMLREKLKTPGLEVINCGISGLTSLGQVEKLPDYLAQDPDLVLDYCGANDVCWDLFRKWRKEAGFWKRIAGKSWFLVNRFDGLALPPEEEIRRDIRAGLISNLGVLRENLESRNIPLILSTFGYPDLAQCTSEQRDFYDRDLKTTWRGDFLTIEAYCRIMEMVNEEIRAFGRARNLQVIPLAEELDGGWNLFQDVCHLTQNGILVKADIMSRHLERVVAERLREIPSP